VLASCDFATTPILDRSGSGGGEPMAGSDSGMAGRGGSGGKSGSGGATGTGGGGSGGIGGACVRNAFIECQGSAAIRCAANGRDRTAQDCGTPGCNASQKRCNVCTPAETYCADPATLATCGPDGLTASDAACDEGCNSAVSPAICNHCAPGISFCLDADTVRSCDNQGNAQSDTDCLNGCTPTSSSAAQCNQCSPGAVLGCADTSHQSRCKSDGTGPEMIDCANGCSGDGICNVCDPDSQVCSDANTSTTCNAAGTDTTDMQCGFGCSAGACNACNPSTTECQGNKLVVCSAAGTTSSSNTCTYGCDATATPNACKSPTLVPSNLYDASVVLMPANPCETVTVQDLSVPVAGSLTINTDVDGSVCTRVKSQLGSLPEICVMVRRNISFGAASTVTVTGSRALALVATGTISLAGTIDVSADGPVGGPGSLAASASQNAAANGMPNGESTPGNAGGGGGGFGMAGGTGGSAPGTSAGSGGVVQGMVSIVPLRSGSSGGTNSALSGTPRQGLPGGGGGALQIVGCTSMTVTASALFDANGGGGQGGRPGSSSTPGAGAGGGSGGAVLIEAQTMTLASGARFYANGGGGGGGATLSGAGGDGQDGQAQNSAATGGTASIAMGATSKDGGTGGATMSSGTPIAAGPGGSVPGGMMGMMSAAGGGGGGVGRIRLNNTAGSLGSATLIASPNIGTSMVGTIGTCTDTATPTGPCLR
jgi:hypothetical protein